MVPDLHGDGSAVIEANERPGLLNHEHHPTADRFLDVVFPSRDPPPDVGRSGRRSVEAVRSGCGRVSMGRRSDGTADGGAAGGGRHCHVHRYRRTSMNVRGLMTTIPLIRRAWRVLPGPWRLPLLIIGGGWWIYQRVSSNGDEDAPA